MAAEIPYDLKGVREVDEVNEIEATGSVSVRVPGQIPECLRHYSPEQLTTMKRRLVRKIDLRLMPAFIIIYILNYLDRNAIAAAKLAGLTEELHLTSIQYQTCVSILFVGYILMQVPSNLFLNKIGKPAYYLPTCMILWGMLCACSGAVHGYGGLLATRFLLGFIEAAYFPGCMVTLAAWYTRKELSLRTAFLYCGSLLSGAFSGLISAGVTRGMNGVRGISSWRWLFIIEGSITIGVAFGAYFILPNFPANTKGITEEERALALWRLEEDIGEEDWTSQENQTFFTGFKECVVDYKTWLLVLLVVGAVSSGTINSFFPTIVATLGKGTFETLLLTAPPYLLACFVALGVSLSADRTGERYFHFTIPLWTSIAGYIISASTTSTAPRYFAMMIMLPGVYTAFIVGMAWVANTLPRPPAKRAAALALANACGNISSIWGAYLYPASSSPRYLIAMGTNTATALMSIIVATIFRMILVRINKRLDREEEQSLGAAAITDVEEKHTTVNGMPPRKGFRYLY